MNDLPAATPGAEAKGLDGNGGVPRGLARAVALGCLPLAVSALAVGWNHPAYRFLPFAWAAAGWLMWRGWRAESGTLVPGSPRVAACLLGVALFWSACATVLWSPWGGTMAALTALAGLVWWAGGQQALSKVLPGLVLVALSTPLPLGWDRGGLQWLGGKMISAASRMLFGLEVPHLLARQWVELPRLTVPLDGLRELTNALPLVVAFSLCYPLCLRRSAWRCTLTVPVGAAVGVLSVLLAMVYAIRGSFREAADLTMGGRGFLLLTVCVTVACLLVASWDQFLEFLCSPIRPKKTAPGQVAPASPTSQMLTATASAGWARMAAWSFLTLASVQAPLAAVFLWRELVPTPPLISRLPANTAFTLPPLPGTWRAVAAAPLYLTVPVTNTATRGVWFLTQDRLAAAVVLEYPVAAEANWLDYWDNAGWKVVSGRSQGVDGSGPPWVEGSVQKDWAQAANYWLAECDEDGNWIRIALPRPTLLSPFQPRVSSTAFVRVHFVGGCREALTEADRRELGELFQTVRLELGRQVAAHTKGR